jgi:hypothetical protein
VLVTTLGSWEKHIEKETQKGDLRCQSRRWGAGRKRSPNVIDRKQTENRQKIYRKIWGKDRNIDKKK